MNVLLVIPKTITRDDEWYVFPLGIAYVSSALRNSEICNLYTYNLNLARDVRKKICELIDENQIDIIATGGLSVQYHSIKTIIETAKKHKTEIITMVGGGYITSSPELAMEAMPEIDIGMIGEGEVTICELVNALTKGEELTSIMGIIFRSTEGLVKTDRRKPISDLDSIAFPDYEGFDFGSTLKYSPVNYGIYNKRAAVLITSRGCPYNCTFCFHPQGDGYRARSLDNVFREIDWLVEKYNIKSILILDELFGGNNARLKEFCTRIKEYNLQWWVETRVQFATIENLTLMKNSGCVQILLGIENVNDSILKSMQKYITVRQIESALSNAYQVGISAPGVLIFGDPLETRETADNSINWWKQHPEYNIMLTTMQVYPGSAIWDYAIKKGILATKEDQINHILSGCPKLNLTSMSNEDFLDLCKQIGLLNQSRIMYVADASVSNERWEEDKLSADVTGKCARCGMVNHWTDVNLLAEGGGAETFICQNCGQSHTNSFQNYYFMNAVDNMKNVFDMFERIVLWGQGRKLVKIFSEYQNINELEFFYVDSSPAKKGKEFFGLTIHSPSEIENYYPQVIILAVGDANMSVVKDKCNEIIETARLPRPRIYTLGELMNPKFNSTAAKA